MVKIMEKPIKMDDLGVPLFSEASIYYIYIYVGGIGLYMEVYMYILAPSSG